MPNSEAGSILDAEFLFLLSLLRPLYAQLPTTFRGHARAWLQRLCWVPACGDMARADRNEYLCRLYMGMQKEELGGVFLEEPPEGPLMPAAETFPEVDLGAWLDSAVENGTGSECAVDGRTYLASHALPEGRGAFGYLAVSMAKGEPHFVPPEQKSKVSAEHSSFGAPQATSTPCDSQPQSTPKRTSAGLKDILGCRPRPEQRRRLLELYDSLLADVEQAEREPSVPSPELDKLIASCQNLSVEGDTSEQRKELLSQLRSRLRARRERVSRRAGVLDLLEVQGEEALAAGAVADMLASGPRDGDGLPAIEVEDEDSVWNIRPENIALLEAAYPRELVCRFLDAIVHERVATLGRVQARRYCQNHVNGLEEDAAEDMEHYRDATSALAGLLRHKAEDDKCESAELARTALSTREEMLRCVRLADEAAGLMRQLDAARRGYFHSEERLRAEQEQLRADIEVLRAEEAAQLRQLEALKKRDRDRTEQK